METEERCGKRCLDIRLPKDSSRPFEARAIYLEEQNEAFWFWGVLKLRLLRTRHEKLRPLSDYNHSSGTINKHQRRTRLEGTGSAHIRLTEKHIPLYIHYRPSTGEKRNFKCLGVE